MSQPEVPTLSSGNGAKIPAIGFGTSQLGDCADVVARALDAGLLLRSAGAEVVRLAPPLNVADEDLEKGLELLEGVL